MTIVTGTLANIGIILRLAPSGGVREITPLRNGIGRSRQGTIPSCVPSEAPRGRQDVVEMSFEAEIADDVGPLAARGERDGAGPLAHGKAFHRAQANPGLAVGGDSSAQRVEQSLAEAIFARLAGDADVERRVALIVGRGHWRDGEAAQGQTRDGARSPNILNGKKIFITGAP